MEIRKATALDIDAIVELNRQIGEIHHAHYPRGVLPAFARGAGVFCSSAIGAEGRLFCVAEQDGRVVGFLTARIDINESVPFLTRAPICRIGSVVVDEQHRSRGIGKALITHCDAVGQGP